MRIQEWEIDEIMDDIFDMVAERCDYDDEETDSVLHTIRLMFITEIK